MQFHKKILCTICARGGSKGVPNKNIIEIAGLPLIAHSIKHAKDAGCFYAIAVSSDCDNILKIALESGADYVVKRPSELASDTAGKIPSIVHCAESIESLLSVTFDIFVDLDVTSPLRNSSDIINAIQLLLDKKAENLITGSTARRSPYFNLVEEYEQGYVHLSKKTSQAIVRRQDVPKCFDMNASIYIWTRKALLEDKGIFLDKTVLYEMPMERSIDIDCLFDLKIVRSLLEGDEHEQQ